MAYLIREGNIQMLTSSIEINKVCAVIVTYNPNIDEFKDNVGSVANQVDRICIVDNSTDASLQEKVLKLGNQNSVHVISNKGNFGIAYAQNIGMKWALAEGYDAFFLLDQDTKLNDETVSNLIMDYNYLANQNKKVACLGPLAFDRDQSEENVYHNYGSGDEKIIEVQQTLSSGSLIPKDALINVGGMEEGLFIDIVDYEWCWRAKERGYSTFVTKGVKVAHRLGEDRYYFLGKGIGVPSPIRHYYQFRNTLKMFTRSYVPVGFKLKYSIILPFKCLFFSLFVKPRGVRFKMIFKGIIDAMRGVKGNINGERPKIASTLSHE